MNPALNEMAGKALKLLGFDAKPNRDLFIFREGSPHLDIDVLLEQLGATGNPVARIFAQLRIQYRIERFLEMLRNRPADLADAERTRVESLALGICQQLLLFRLPGHSSKELAVWLMNPDTAPRVSRPALRELLWVQRERNTRSAAWAGMIEGGTGEERLPAPSETRREPPVIWEGLPVHAGRAEGPVIVDPKDPDDLAASQVRPVVVFSSAKPETVRFFPHAAAILYARGSVLSHACSLAREQGIPCVTALGNEFVLFLNETKPARLRVQADAGTITLIPDQA